MLFFLPSQILEVIYAGGSISQHAHIHILRGARLGRLIQLLAQADPQSHYKQGCYTSPSSSQEDSTQQEHYDCMLSWNSSGLLGVLGVIARDLPALLMLLIHNLHGA